MNMKCPSCGKANLVRRTRNMPYTCKGESTAIRSVSGDFCPACGEAVLDSAESKQIGMPVQHLEQFHQRQRDIERRWRAEH